MMPGMMGPGNGQGPPKEMLQLLATLMLNKRLQQRKPRPAIPPNGGPVGQSIPGTRADNRMAQLAQMQLETMRPPGM